LVRIGATAVGDYFRRAREVGFGWRLPDHLWVRGQATHTQKEREAEREFGADSAESPGQLLKSVPCMHPHAETKQLRSNARSGFELRRFRLSRLAVRGRDPRQEPDAVVPRAGSASEAASNRLPIATSRFQRNR
jgi:hypothetical protein